MKTEFKDSKSKWECIFTVDNRRAIRNENGIICVLTKPSRYTGQNDRYEKDLKENLKNQKLIAEAPNLLEALNELIIGYEEIWKKNYKHAILTPEYLNARKAMRQAMTITETE